MKLILLFFLLSPLLVFSQKITGRVLNAEDNKPVPGASIFLANATVGNSSNNEGAFTLNNVKPGQYELAVSVVGFETYRTNVLMASSDIVLTDIKLKPKAIELKEVSITPDKNWVEKYELFKREFLGPSKLAQKCKILNPEVLTLQYEDHKVVLTGSSYDFLEIENHELGYRIKYLLNKFIRNAKTGLVYYEGSPLFTDMKGTPSQVKRWQKKRLDVFKGSSMHFLRSVLGNRLTEDGFEVRRLIRKKDSAGRALFGNAQLLVKTPLAVTDFTKLTDIKGIYALSFSDFLYVMYTKKRERHDFRPAYQPADAPDYATSVIGFEDEYGFFDSNGVMVNPAGVVFEGAWAGQRMAEMLPVDYTPPAK
ncbi:carboxypeptidase-like regulatory domain-containing protein [Mucilaginibacter limnophilus]|uniref:Carboxypeptidase-like regulatory domain-containing protein n=1 Tax=Mucilaginibacter limnophilus TaxID=1932778 RepID=A0A3S2V084_9SPHI|nr:carboxypeptidase-like regulatory domain-containing protein [Mucilaginibacter limnophilus]RVT98399.1 carboxypeptidase-like regulatory domain-containing protein [Mucilaginibacter limnophilus]